MSQVVSRALVFLFQAWTLHDVPVKPRITGIFCHLLMKNSSDKNILKITVHNFNKLWHRRNEASVFILHINQYV